MPRKKSVKRSAKKFSAEADKILSFLTTSTTAGLGDEHVSWCHDLAIIRLYRAFEALMLDALVGALNNDTSTLSSKMGFSFPKHLTDEVCRFLVTGRRGYFNFKGRDDLIKTLKDYLPKDHYLISIVSDDKYRHSLDLLTKARNYAAHESEPAKTAFKNVTGRTRVGTAGAWLKRSSRFSDVATDLKQLAAEVDAKAPF